MKLSIYCKALKSLFIIFIIKSIIIQSLNVLHYTELVLDLTIDPFVFVIV